MAVTVEGYGKKLNETFATTATATFTAGTNPNRAMLAFGTQESSNTPTEDSITYGGNALTLGSDHDPTVPSGSTHSKYASAVSDSTIPTGSNNLVINMSSNAAKPRVFGVALSGVDALNNLAYVDLASNNSLDVVVNGTNGDTAVVIVFTSSANAITLNSGGTIHNSSQPDTEGSYGWAVVTQAIVSGGTTTVQIRTTGAAASWSGAACSATPHVDPVAALSGSASTSAAGTQAPGTSVALSGFEATFAQGDVISGPVAVGSEVSVSTGTTAPSADVSVSGSAATFGQGDLSVSNVDDPDANTFIQCSQGTMIAIVDQPMQPFSVPAAGGISTGKGSRRKERVYINLDGRTVWFKSVENARDYLREAGDTLVSKFEARAREAQHATTFTEGAVTASLPETDWRSIPIVMPKVEVRGADELVEMAEDIQLRSYAVLIGLAHNERMRRDEEELLLLN